MRQNEARLAEESERHARTEQTRRNLESEIRSCKQDLQKVDAQVQKNQLAEKQYAKQYEERRHRLGKFLLDLRLHSAIRETSFGFMGLCRYGAHDFLHSRTGFYDLEQPLLRGWTWLCLQFWYSEQQQLSKKQSSAVTQEELRRLSSELRKIESEINSKNEQIEKLNRDMRKVNLQSFVRETNSSKNGSKVGNFSSNFPRLKTA